MAKKWSEDDISLLKYCYFIGNMSRAEIARTLDRTTSAMIQKATQLRREGAMHEYINRPISDEEIEFIKLNYKKIEVQDAARLLSRSSGSIIKIAKIAGVSKFKFTTKQEIAQIRYLAERGLYSAIIARKLKISHNKVYLAKKRHNIRIKKATIQEQTATLRKLIAGDMEAIRGKVNKV